MAKKVEAVTFFMSMYDEGVKKMMTDAGYTHTNELLAADVVIFTGGPDVTPLIYGEKRHPSTYSTFNRDIAEIKMFHQIPWDVPKVGICRGAQLLNVLVGRGRLFQDVDNHTKEHEITDMYSGQTILASSTHHQQMRPGPGADVLWIATESTRKCSDIAVWDAANSKIKAEFWTDPEVVYYDDGVTLCFQPHPELPAPKYNALRSMFFDTLETFLLTKEQGAILTEARNQRKAL